MQSFVRMAVVSACVVAVIVAVPVSVHVLTRAGPALQSEVYAVAEALVAQVSATPILHITSQCEGVEVVRSVSTSPLRITAQLITDTVPVGCTLKGAAVQWQMESPNLTTVTVHGASDVQASAAIDTDSGTASVLVVAVRYHLGRRLEAEHLAVRGLFDPVGIQERLALALDHWVSQSRASTAVPSPEVLHEPVQASPEPIEPGVTEREPAEHDSEGEITNTGEQIAEVPPGAIPVDEPELPALQPVPPSPPPPEQFFDVDRIRNRFGSGKPTGDSEQ